jgi:hypothetical protein
MDIDQVSGRRLLARSRTWRVFPTAYEDRLSLDEAYCIQLALIDAGWRRESVTSDGRSG